MRFFGTNCGRHGADLRLDFSASTDESECVVGRHELVVLIEFAKCFVHARNI
jgi:hypothetical protein